MIKNIKKGFTLIELLVVISIIGILASIVLVSFSTAQKQGRDAERKSDLKQYQTLLEQFANTSASNGGFYPAHTSATTADTLCGLSDLNLAIACPVDPKNGTLPYGYNYLSDGTTGITATKYELYAYLESSSNYWIVCSNGTTVTSSSVPTINTCP